MTIDIFRRYAHLDPASSKDVLPDWSSLAPVLLEAIDERTRPMQTQEIKPAAPAGRGPRLRGPLLAAAVFTLVLIVAGVAYVLLRGDAEPDAIDGAPNSPIDVLDEWTDAMNEGDVDNALSVLSPEAECSLPVVAPVSCEQHLGYLAAIGTHFEKQSCTAEAPYICSYGLTSQLHATLGYPDYELPMSAEFTLDESGLLVADFFGTVDVTTPYWPTEGGELWSFMIPDYPELNLDGVFGPEIYDRAAGVAAMEGARSFNDPVRIVSEFEDTLRSGFLPSRSPVDCRIDGGPVTCTPLLEFLVGIDAELGFECDGEAASSDRIGCTATIESDIHSALGSGPATAEASFLYRGGRVIAFELSGLPFADSPGVHEAFVAFAAGEEGLVRDGDAVLTGETAAAWVEAAGSYGG